nr:RNA-directed DNA polymerase, eukaryota [Tanacetum cinerariifolium]
MRHVSSCKLIKKCLDTTSCNNSEADKFENLEDDLCENGPLDKEAGEIPNNDAKDDDEYVKNTHCNRFSCGGSHQSPKQPSHYSSAPVKPSRVSKSQTKSFGNQGSMIEAFVSHIEMGNVLGYDTEDSKNDLKKFIDSLGARQVSFLGIQETHATKLDPFKIKRTWGNSQFDFVESPSSGRSGGLVSIWDPNVFSKVNDFQFENLLIVEGTWIVSRIHCFMINVYAPQDDSKKRLWNDIFDIMNSKRSHHLIFGDFNMVRFASERFGSVFNHASTNVFNQFIRDAHLWDIPFGGHLFTRFNKHGDKLNSLNREKEELSNKIIDFDANIASRSSDFIIDSQRALWIDRLRDIELKENTDASQKAKIRWDIEADENSNFFHAMVNQKRRGCNTSFITLIPKVPSPMVFSDFRLISLIGAQYKIIAKVWANRLARVIDTVISMEQSAFIKQRQILDGPLMVNEVIQWCKRKKSKLMVLHFMGFNETWIRWISGCLHSVVASILINGSPTYEFNIHRGLRQGDPLSPFLFIIAMEGIHVAMKDAMSAGLYNGFRINTLNLSHLFFVDDALFIEEWSNTNIKSLVSNLDCFNQVSGLKINFNKSNLFGVGVPFAEVVSLASITGCNALSTPFNYLGLPIDCNMALVKSWDPIIDKVCKRLSNWKASLLSIGGRTTLITSVLGAIGGLGIGSLYSLNHALIQKWRWRFLHNPHALWVRLIVAIHGPNEDSTFLFRHIKCTGVWNRNVGSINSMHEKGFIPHSLIQRRVNNALNKGALVRDCWNNCWHLSWSRNISSGTNANLLNNLLSYIQNMALNDSEDVWVWSSSTSAFTIKDARGKIDDGFLPDDGFETRWN